MKNGSSGDPHGGIALPVVDCKPALKKMRGNVSWERPHHLPELMANRFDGIDGIHTPAVLILKRYWNRAAYDHTCSCCSIVKGLKSSIKQL